MRHIYSFLGVIILCILLPIAAMGIDRAQVESYEQLTANMITSEYLNATASDAAIRLNGTDVAFMPGWSTNPWAVYIPSINLNETLNYKLYSSGVTGGKVAYFPGTAGVTTNDGVITEFGNNFAVEQKVFVPTYNSSDIVWMEKAGAFRTAVIGTGVIESEILAASTTMGKYYSTSTALSLYTGGITRAGSKNSSFSGVIYQAQTYLLKSGSPTGTAYARLRSVIDDSIITTFGSVDVSTLTGSLVLYTFNTNLFTVSSPQNVRLTIEYTGGDAGNYVGVGYVNSGSTYTLTTYNGSYTDTINQHNTGIQASYYPITTYVQATGIASGEHVVKTYTEHNLITNGSFETADPPSNWTKVNLDGAPTFARSNTQVKIGSFSGRTNGECYIYQDLGDMSAYIGQTVTAGCWVYSTVVGQSFVQISEDGGISMSETHDGTGWEWLYVSRVVSATPTNFELQLYNLNSPAVNMYFDGAKLVTGSTIIPTLIDR